MLPEDWMRKFKKNPRSSISFIKNRILGLDNLEYNIRRGGLARGTKQFLGEQYVRLRFDGGGTPIYETDWEVLVVLDACRVDLFRTVAPEYEFLPKVNTFRSLGSWTGEWMKANFTPSYSSEMASTAYVSGNPQSDNYLNPDDFYLLDDVWSYAWDDELGTVPPRPVTDRAVRIAREHSPDRLVIHYLQPHVPFIGSDESPELKLYDFAGRNMEGISLDDWILVLRGDRDLESVWEEYERNLRYVLDDVEILVENLDANPMVITSDHGNAIGEYGIFGHPGVPLPSLRIVPWCELNTTDLQTYDPPTYDTSPSQTDVVEKLKSLGYHM